MQRSLVLIKPDVVKKGVWLDVIKVYEGHGLTIGQTRIFSPMSKQMARKLYSEHQGKDFFGELIEFMTKGQTIALMIVGQNAVSLVRALNGATKPNEAEEGTIRKMFGSQGPANAVHGSANSVDAERELRLIFHNPQCAECGYMMDPVGETCWKCPNCFATQGS